MLFLHRRLSATLTHKQDLKVKFKKKKCLSSELKTEWEAQTHLNITVFSEASRTSLIFPVLHKTVMSPSL